MLTNTSVEGSQNTHDPIMLNVSQLTCLLKRVYIGVKTCEVFLCFAAIVRVRRGGLGSIMLTSLFSLCYVTAECHWFLHRR